ncbi:unnamed protein product [Tenebrio molitor]|nr:unnamed protein product [Tenebrio molitor]
MDLIDYLIKIITLFIGDDRSVFLHFFFFVFLVCKCILVIHCCFQNKNLY